MKSQNNATTETQIQTNWEQKRSERNQSSAKNINQGMSKQTIHGFILGNTCRGIRKVGSQKQTKIPCSNINHHY